MGNYIGYVDNSVQYANRAFIAFLKTTLEAEGWTTNRYDTSTDTHELLMAAPGYTGPDGDVNAYVGFRSYESVASDYYNVSVAGFTGYVADNTFVTQPGYVESGVPAHNQRIDYWVTVNDRRVAFGLKVGTPVYESAYVGFMLPYATPRQFPYPLVCGGMLTGVPATRFSDTSHSIPYKGNRANFKLRGVSGSYLQPYTHPWGNGRLAGSHGIRPTDTYYPLPRVVLYDSGPNVYGELDGIHYITGFDNLVENTLVIDGVTYVVIQDAWRNGFIDYYALRLDP